MHRTAVGISVGIAFFANVALLADETDSKSHFDPASSPPVRVEPASGLISVDVSDISLAALIAEIARSTKTTYVLESPLSELVTAQFEDLTLDEAMTRLLHRKSYMLQYIPPSVVTSDELPRSRLWVFSELEVPTDGSPDDAHQASITPLDVGRTVIEGADDIAALMEREDTATVSALDAALGKGNVGTRREAAYALGEIGDAASIGLLTQALADPDLDVREAVVDAFADIGGDVSAHALSVALQDEDVGLRESALYALAEIGGQTAVALLAQAQYDPDGSVRETAIELLAEVGDQSALATRIPATAKSH